MTLIPKTTQLLLDNYDWEDTAPRLLKYALQKVRCLTWKGVPKSGEIAQEVVQEAIVKTFSGERSWFPEKHPDLFIHLKSVIKSLISHAVNSMHNTKHVFESSIYPENNTSFFEKKESEVTSPLQNILEEEAEKEANEFLYNLTDYLHDDTALIKLLECFIDGINKPRDIAKKLNIDIAAVYNLQKRMRRAYENFKSTLDHVELEHISKEG